LIHKLILDVIFQQNSPSKIHLHLHYSCKIELTKLWESHYSTRSILGEYLSFFFAAKTFWSHIQTIDKPGSTASGINKNQIKYSVFFKSMIGNVVQPVFFLKILFLFKINIFGSFWCVDIKNNFLKIKKSSWYISKRKTL
jgi:hypothetical protein